MMKKIYTLGTDRRSEEDFVEILLAYNINSVIDVRSFPKSKLPIFNKEYLQNLLQREGIDIISSAGNSAVSEKGVMSRTSSRMVSTKGLICSNP